MRHSALLLITFLLNAGCSQPFRPESIHPTMERIYELARIEEPLDSKKLPIKIFMSPAIAFNGMPVKLTCLFPHIPPEHYARFVFGIRDVSTSSGMVNSREVTGRTIATCEPQMVVCSVDEAEEGITLKTHTTSLEIVASAGCEK